MTKTTKWGIIASAACLAGALGIALIGISNSDYARHNLAEAQQMKMKTRFTATWTILRQQAGVADSYKDSFMAIYPKLMDARYSGKKDLLMQWVQESNPEFKTTMLEKLMDSIEVQQGMFTREQETAQDIMREDANAHQMFPSSILLGGRKLVTFQFVTSSETEEAFETGRKDDIDLFKKGGK